MFEDQIQDLNALKIVQNKQIYELKTQLDGIESNNSALDIQGRTSDQVEISSTSNSNDESQPTIKRLKALLRDSELALSMEEEGFSCILVLAVYFSNLLRYLIAWDVSKSLFKTLSTLT